MVNHEPQPKRRRRWYQFNLRTLILFVLICAVPAAWVGWKLEAIRRERVAVAEIRKLGGSVWYHEMKGPDWITRHFRKVQGVILSGNQVTDAGLVHLKELPDLEGLSLEGTQITDTGLVHLEGLAKLQELHLRATQITDTD